MSKKINPEESPDFVSNKSQAELIAKGFYPYDQNGNMVPGLEKMSEIEQGDYTISELEGKSKNPVFEEKSGRSVKVNPKKMKYIAFLDDVSEIDLELYHISLETKVRLLQTYFPGRFNFGKAQSLTDEYGRIIENRTNGAFKGVFDYARKIRNKRE
jgi:hypothetical protein